MKKKILIVLLALLLLAAAAGWVLYSRHQAYLESHVFIGDAVYLKALERLDLRGSDVSVEYYEQLRAALPDCDIYWDVPFQGRSYSSDTTAISVTELSPEDMERLPYLLELKQVDASACRDYEALAQLEARRPDLEVIYDVVIGEEAFSRDVTELAFDRADAGELMEKLRYLPALERVRFEEGTLSAQDLLALREAYPAVTISWEKTVMGSVYPDTVTELDFSGRELPPLEELEADMRYFPSLEKLILCDCGIDNETMAAFRERVREEYKVVWRVSMGKWNRLTVRTDETTFMPRKEKVNMQNEEMNNLKYCEDMIVVDIGHMGHVVDLDWLYGLPKLQFLVMVGTGVSDLTPIGSLKELIYLELFQCDGITDYTPLVGCTALEDVNVAYTHGDPSVFAQMPWLRHLWINGIGKVSPETREMLKESLPDTVIEFDSGWTLGGGWRALPNYYVMRDLLEMPYYAWGNNAAE